MASAAAFEPQPLEAPLNDDAKQALRQLSSRRIKDYSIYDRLKSASALLEKAVGELNEHAKQQETARTRRLEKLQERGEDEDDDEREVYENMQATADELTKAMDKSIRAVVDGRVWLEELPDNLKHVSSKASDATQATQRTTQRTVPDPTQDATPQLRPLNEDEDMADEDSNIPQAPDYSETPSALLHDALSMQKTKWSVKTLTEKYGHDNDYTGFYSSRFTAQNPGDNPPPMPAAGLWFAAEEGRNAASSQRQAGGDDSDSDIEVAAERVSIKCPLTLLPFVDPVTSQKCKHSYEREAIMNMFRTSKGPEKLTPAEEAEVASLRDERRRIARRKALEAGKKQGLFCPECRVFFQEHDLRDNPTLQRRAQREVELQQRKQQAEEDEEEDSDDDADMIIRGTQRRPVGVGSSPMGSQRRSGAVKNETRLKNERLSGQLVPGTQGLPSGTQMTGQGAMVVDLDGDSETEPGDSPTRQ